ncbi:MAG: hypothetical protein L3K14_08750 [Thermoplasmata archaeon]|nr:hypothetical protein [Thermoplasmata archaeon]
MTGFLRTLLPQVTAQILDPRYLRAIPTSPFHRAPSLRAAVRGAPDGWAVLVERKHESPGSGMAHLPTPSLDLFVEQTRTGGADGLSCLATEPAFGGSPREVAELARRSGLPVLFKDFVIDPIQVEAASLAGAAAILLIARLETEGLLRRPIQELAAAAKARGLEVLLELHRPEEWRLAESAAPDLIGINLRDLDTLELRPAVAESTFRAANQQCPVLGFSGVSTPTDALRYRRWGADGLLVGTGFARARNPAEFLRSLRVPHSG